MTLDPRDCWDKDQELAPLSRIPVHVLITGTLFGLIAASLVWFASCARGVDVRAISGTEQVAVYEFSISVSPDERWLAFTEWSLPKSRVFQDLPPNQYESRVATLNLRTGEVVRHAMNSIPLRELGFGPHSADGIGQAGLEIIEQRFRPPGWRGEMFYFQPYYSGIQVALDPGRPGMIVVEPPADTLGSCSDCPPTVSVRFRDRSWNLLSNHVSVAYRSGEVLCIYYCGEGPFRTNMILRLCREGEEETIVEREKKKGTLMSVAGLRVAPDGRHLAYTVHSKRQAFLSGPREELFIRDLETGREKKIGTFADMGNLMWSSDSSRLYFASGEYSGKAGVRIVDVSAMFER